MSKEQREAIDHMLHNAPFDLGGDVIVQRPLLEQMLIGHPLADDIRMTSGELGGVPVIFIKIAETEPKGCDPSHARRRLFPRLGHQLGRLRL